MTLSLASAFDFAGRRAVCIAADKVTVYHWGRAGLSDSFMFDADDSGLSFFMRYMEESPEIPVYLLVDAIEEEFRSETLPHSSGNDRRALLARRQARSFRNTPYIHAEVQGRESSGRRDDRVLLAGLTNPELLTPWLNIFEQVKVPVAGIYSLPLLSRLLLQSLKLTSGQVLLLTVQAASGLRQSCFVDGQLRASRLAKLSRASIQQHADLIAAELERFRRYLVSARVTVREEPLTICVLSHGEMLHELAARLKDGDLLSHRLLDVARVARELKVSGVLTSPYSDAIFAHLLLSRLPRNHYGTNKDIRYFQMHRLRLGLYGSAVATLVGGLLYAGFQGIEGMYLAREASNIRQRVGFYTERLAVARSGLPATLVEPFDVEKAVLAVEQLEQAESSPRPAMALIGRGLASQPGLSLVGLDWSLDASPEPAATAGSGERAKALSVLPGPQKQLNKPWRLYQRIEINGEVREFRGDFRAAIAAIEALAATLAAETEVFEVRLMTLPIDADSSAMMSGTATREEASGGTLRAPEFRLQVVQAME